MFGREPHDPNGDHLSLPSIVEQAHEIAPPGDESDHQDHHHEQAGHGDHVLGDAAAAAARAGADRGHGGG